MIWQGDVLIERIAATRTSARIIGLRPDRAYTFTIRAYDLAGNASDPLKYALRTRAEAENPGPGPGPEPGPGPTPRPGGAVETATPAQLRSVSFSGRLLRPARANRRAFIVLARPPAVARTPVLKVALSSRRRCGSRSPSAAQVGPTRPSAAPPSSERRTPRCTCARPAAGTARSSRAASTGYASHSRAANATTSSCASADPRGANRIGLPYCVTGIRPGA